MDRLTSLQVFVRVAELGGFAAAAQASGMSATMAAKHVQSLEAALGGRLLHRTTRRQSLTEIGRLYLERARAVLAEFEAAQAAAGELQAEPRGLLRVTAPVVLGSRGLAPLLGSFMAAHRQIQIELSLHDRVVDLVDEGFDLALRSGPLADSGFIARPLRPLRMLLCAAPAYLAAHGAPQQPVDLSSHACLGFAHWTHPHRWRLIGPEGEVQVPIRSPLVINNGEALHQAALGGAGILMQSELLLSDDLAAGRLVRVLPQHAPPPRPAHLLHLPDRRPSAKLQRFIAHVLQHLGPD